MEEDVYRRAGRERWREAVEAEQRRRREEAALFDPSTLSPPQKRRVWDRIRERDPALADALTSDAVRDLREMFDAKVMLPRDLVMEALDERS